jgi:DnaJ-class molecular chaperone
MPKRDYYVVLGVSRRESAGGIRAAFRDLVRRYHPDRAGTSATRFYRDVVEAYDVLSDAERRAAYDRGLRHADSETVPAAEPVVTPRPSRPRPPAEPLVPDRVSVMRDFHVTRPSYEEVYERFLRNFVGPEPRHRESLDALRLQIIISRDQALRGGELTLGVPVFHPCAACRGTGWQYPYRCDVCGGARMIEQEEPVTLTVPPGVAEGTEFQVPLRGLGIHNLYLLIRVRVAD